MRQTVRFHIHLQYLEQKANRNRFLWAHSITNNPSVSVILNHAVVDSRESSTQLRRDQNATSCDILQNSAKAPRPIDYCSAHHQPNNSH